MKLEQDIAGLLPQRDFDRRDFLWAALGASAALAAAAPASAQQIVTDSSGIDASDVSIPVANGQLRGYRAMPLTNGPFPTVLVAAEIFGLNAYVKDVCRRLAKAGYYAIVPDLYSRKVDLTTITNIAEIMPIVNSKYDSELIGDYDSTLEFARSSFNADVSRVAMTGFCRGGRSTLIYASAQPSLKAAAAWYGPVGGQVNSYTPRTAMDRVGEIKVPLLGLYGAKDAGIPVDQVEKFFAALKAAGTPSELVVYPDAGHGFHADFRPDSYRKGDAENAWGRMLAWFRQYGV